MSYEGEEEERERKNGGGGLDWIGLALYYDNSTCDRKNNKYRKRDVQIYSEDTETDIK